MQLSHYITSQNLSSKNFKIASNFIAELSLFEGKKQIPKLVELLDYQDENDLEDYIKNIPAQNLIQIKPNICSLLDLICKEALDKNNTIIGNLFMTVFHILVEMEDKIQNVNLFAV